ncbi:ABC transporter permease [Fodinibius sp. Rm-B-1B1-1]|uniref:ABC transporter permease n=1 Tax=Fodinibius alkaliphilus TaxID=3140241 RepID=UPI003159E8BD
MLLNYIKTALRNLSQHKSYAGINLLGLSVAMACCILIALYVHEELSFDQFHKKADRLISVGVENDQWGRSRTTPYPLAETMVEEIPGIERATRVSYESNLLLSGDKENYVKIDDAKYAEPDFFELFSFGVVEGNPREVLDNPDTILLSRSTARNVFGYADEVVGRPVYWQKRDTVKMLQVGAVVEDPPVNSTIQFDMLISYQTKPAWGRDMSAWRAFAHHTYALLSSPEVINTLPAQFNQLVKNHYDIPEGEDPSRSFFSLQIKDLHLSELSNSSGFTGNRTYLYLFGSIALFILSIACVNYINLATARTSIRAKEIGVRKTLGAVRPQLVAQFLGESVLLSFSSFIIGGIISVVTLPYFNQMFGTNLNWQVNITFLLGLLLASIVVGVLAGMYPALYLSKFAPVSVLQNKSKKGSSGSWLRQTLVVIQFALATSLIVSAFIVYQQLQYTQEKDLGFEGEQVVSVSLPSSAAWDNRENLKDRLRQHPSVQDASVVSSMPGGYAVRIGYRPERISSQAKTDSDQTIMFAPSVVDYKFLELLDIDLVAGRFFSRDLSSDRTQAYIFNEKGAEELGWTPEEAVGKTVTFREEGEIIGVVENFHIRSLKEEIEPVTLQLFEPSSWSSGGNLLARLSPDHITEGLEIIESEMEKYAANWPFEYEFLDEKFDAMYRTEFRLGRIVILFTIVAIIIACMGLYGLSAFAAERRTKEIGIRKVLGANVSGIVTLLSKDFLKLVLTGFILAVPVTWYVMNKWLQNFAYRIDIEYTVFLLAGIIAIIIALVTVSWQAIRVASANPIESLRSE